MKRSALSSGSTPLDRHKPLKAKPRSKGARGERAVIDILKAHGWHGAYRNYSSGAFGGGDILGGPAGVHIECKHHERCSIWQWLAQAESEARLTDIAMVVCRCNGMPWFSVLPKDEWEALRELNPRTRFTLVRNRERIQLWQWIREATGNANDFDVPLVEFKRSTSTWYVAAPFTEVLALLRMRERGV